MTRRVTATTLRSQMFTLVDAVDRGDEVEITRRGRVVARLVPAAGPRALRGRLTGIAVSVDAEDQLFETGAIWEAR